MARDRTNLRAGLFVIVGVTLAFLVIILLSDFSAWFASRKKIEVRFALGDGVAGLKPGAVVSIGDHKIGNVAAIEPDRNKQGRVTRLLVTAEIPDDYTLYENARVELVVPPLGAGSRLDIVSVGRPPGSAGDEPAAGSGVYDAQTDPPLEGGVSPSQFASDFAEEAGIGARQRRQVQQIISNVEHITAALGGDAVDGELAPRARRLDQTLQDVRGAAARLNALSEAIAGDRPPDQLPDRARQIARLVGELNDTVDQARAALDHARRLLVENRPAVKATIDRVAKLIERNEPAIDEAIEAGRQTLAHTEKITAEVRHEMLADLRRLLGKADEAMTDVKSSMDELEHMTTTQRPVIEKMIANLRLASDQFKLAAIEVRRAPWRLLYEPKEKELETENLYDSARSFALAASNLEATASSMKAMLDKYGETIDPDDARLQLMLENMQRTFEKFSEVQDKFWQALEDRDADR